MCYALSVYVCVPVCESVHVCVCICVHKRDCLQMYTSMYVCVNSLSIQDGERQRVISSCCKKIIPISKEKREHGG